MINRKIDLLVLGWDNGDKFGSTMAWAFGVADALELAGQEIPEVWKYRPGACGPSPSIESDEITEHVKAGIVTWEEVRELGNALIRYRKILGERGEDY